MGHSRTINCIGETEPDANGIAEMAYANTALEVLQEIKKNPAIKFWHAQTKTGDRILKLEHDGDDWIRKSDDFVKLSRVKTIPCVCKNGCFICNYSGITTAKQLAGYQDWQIEMARDK